MLQFARKAAFGAVARVRSRGPVHAARWVAHHVNERWWERSLDIETAEYESWKQSIESDSCHVYEPLAYGCIDAAIARLNVDSSRDVFLDYGCGKGRAVIVAARRPFLRVLGVELVEELAEVARENARRSASKLQASVEIITADATKFEVPTDVNVIYLYNPFWDDVLAAVQERIRRSLAIRPRHLKILYFLNANQHEAFSECNWLTQKSNEPEFWENIRLVVYQSIAAGEEASS